MIVNLPIIDGHNDTLTKLLELGGTVNDFIEGTNKLQLDLQKAKKSNILGGFSAIYVPAEIKEEISYSWGFEITKNGFKTPIRSKVSQPFAEKYTNKSIDFFQKLEKDSQGQVKIAKSFEHIEYSINNRVFLIIMSFEGAAVIKPDLSNLEYYYNKGLRSLGLVWSRQNDFGMGAPFCFPHTADIGKGLTMVGKNLVKKCNDLGIIVDLAHINEEGFWDVVEISKKPIVITHTAVHALCPSTRNITDEQIDAVQKSNGVIGINFEPASTSFTEDLLTTRNIFEAIKYVNDLSFTQIINHIRYVADRIGVEHVGFGSDFDGADMPKDMQDASKVGKITGTLIKEGFTQEEVEKICYKNWLRVIKETWK